MRQYPEQVQIKNSIEKKEQVSIIKQLVEEGTNNFNIQKLEESAVIKYHFSFFLQAKFNHLSVCPKYCTTIHFLNLKIFILWVSIRHNNIFTRIPIC